MTDRLQYPVWAAIDPETLSEVQRDEIAWFAALSEPTLPRPDLSSYPSFFIDPVALDEQPPDTSFEWFAALSEPVLPKPDLSSYPSTWIDTETLGEAQRDEIAWFSPLSEPALPRPDLSSFPSWVIDPVALDEQAAAVTDELEWFAPLSEPALPIRNEAWHPFWSIDGENFKDETVAWIAPLSEPTLPLYDLSWYPSSWIDPETLAEAQRDEMAWFSPLSDPTLPRPDLSSHPSWTIDPDALNESGVTPPAPPPAPDAEQTAGHGRKKRERTRKPWWEGEFVDPADLYPAEAPEAEEPSPLRLEFEDIKTRARAAVGVADAQEARQLRSEVATLGRRVAGVERAARQIKRERDMGAVLDRYRTAEQVAKKTSARVEALEVRAQILAEDEKFLELIMEYI